MWWKMSIADQGDHYEIREAIWEYEDGESRITYDIIFLIRGERTMVRAGVIDGKLGMEFKEFHDAMRLATIALADAICKKNGWVIGRALTYFGERIH